MCLTSNISHTAEFECLGQIMCVQVTPRSSWVHQVVTFVCHVLYWWYGWLIFSIQHSYFRVHSLQTHSKPPCGKYVLLIKEKYLSPTAVAMSSFLVQLHTHFGFRCVLCLPSFLILWMIVCVTAVLQIGNILPVGVMPEGTIVCCIEEKTGDRGKLARTSGNFGTIISHNPDTRRTRVKLPSGAKKVMPSSNRAMVGKYALVNQWSKCRVCRNAKVLMVFTILGKFLQIQVPVSMCGMFWENSFFGQSLSLKISWYWSTDNLQHGD